MTDGIFNIELGSGKPLPLPQTLDRQLWLGVAVNGTAELRPLTKLAAVPLALNVADKSVTMEKLADDVKLTLARNKHQPQTGAAWLTGGNSNLNINESDYLGTSDASKLGIRVNAQRIMKYVDACSSTDSGNVITGGWKNNTNSGIGCVIAGGGYKHQNPYTVWEDHPNVIGNSASSYFCFIGSGYDNLVNAAPASSIVGGVDNDILGNYSFIGGGQGNVIRSTDNGYSFIGGGLDNYAVNYASVVGGRENSAGGSYSSVLGGYKLTLGSNSVGYNAEGSGVAVSVGSNIAYFGNVDMWLANNRGTASQLRFYEPSGSGGNYSSFEAQGITADVIYKLPSTAGDVDKVLGIIGQTGSGPFTNTLGWVDPGATAWKLTGNSSTLSITDGGSNYLGTYDNRAFEIRVNQGGSNTQGRRRVLRFVPNNESANIIGGFEGSGAAGNEGNIVVSGVAGGIVLGGGKTGSNHNKVTDHWGIVVGGLRNIAGDDDATYSDAGGAVIVGGEGNSARSAYSFLGGGLTNTIVEDGTIDTTHEEINNYSAIVGGTQNTITTLDSKYSGWSTIAGGKGNEIAARAAFIGGGELNTVNAHYGTVGGGYFNNASVLASTVAGGLYNNASGYGAFIGGGGGELDDATDQNSADASWAAITGGRGNLVEGNYGFIGGGLQNTIGELDPVDTTDALYNTIGGGEGNTIAPPEVDSHDVTHSFIGGGRANRNEGDYSTIGGGDSNKIYSSAERKNTHGVIGGGFNNQIIVDPVVPPDEEVLSGMTIAGGLNNTVAETGSFIGGGDHNTAGEEFASVVGGSYNTAGLGSFIGGGERNQAAAGATHGFNVVGGGGYNIISGTYNFIGGGGIRNHLWIDGDPLPASLSTEGNSIDGANSSSIVGGARNKIQSAASHAFIGGGWKNTISGGQYANIPGGYGLIGRSFARTVLGSFNLDLAPASSSNFQTAPFDDRRIFIIGNGKPEIEMPDPDPDVPAVRHNAYEVSYNGHSIVSDNLGVTWQWNVDDDPTNDPIVAVSTRPAVKGARYVDNTPIAWGRAHVVPGNPGTVTLVSGFGVKATGTYIGPGYYRIDLDYIDPYTSPATQVRADRGSSVVATIEGDNLNYFCLYINTLPVSWNTGASRNEFFVRISKQTFTPPSTLGCDPEDHDFSFVVFGRPDPQ